jgi:hypothetical protein
VNTPTKNALPRIGDLVVVNGAVVSHFTARVENIVYLPDEDQTRIDLDWGEYGKSRVYAHDEGRVWRRVESCN